jgi:hypothetical protein
MAAALGRRRHGRLRTYATRAGIVLLAIAIVLLLGWLAGRATPVPQLDLDQVEVRDPRNLGASPI